MAALALPFPVVVLVFSPTTEHLAIASDDGSIRIYQKPYTKVWKALRNLGPEISSVAFALDSSSTSFPLWVACGQHILCFELACDSLILERKDCIFESRVTEEAEDILNQITINKSYLAYTLDSGIVGTLDLKTKEQKTMKTSHSNLCTNVSFIPNRPREMVSTGYDFNILHHDFPLGTILSSFQVGEIVSIYIMLHLIHPTESPAEPASQISLSPPFIQCLTMSSNGVIACGLADGRIWIGFGGERSLAHRKKRRKWDGLRKDNASYVQVADGPVVDVFVFTLSLSKPSRDIDKVLRAFVNSDILVTLSLLGTLTAFQILEGKLDKKLSSHTVKGILKANSLATNGTDVWVGGISSKNQGIAVSLSLETLQKETEQ
ncbi:hypothetical protein Clacol_006865 [Clathrus columnatus]|uniref:Uncharacterized protein n=1 Tax=Clathrus columnatus TaxID=1419009 RepID=A0AAV5AFV8_9AGAM|nr:hypothetical protein Clacol_006865 [Clathrus columnatus]